MSEYSCIRIAKKECFPQNLSISNLKSSIIDLSLKIFSLKKARLGDISMACPLFLTKIQSSDSCTISELFISKIYFAFFPLISRWNSIYKFSVESTVLFSLIKVSISLKRLVNNDLNSLSEIFLGLLLKISCMRSRNSIVRNVSDNI